MKRIILVFVFAFALLTNCAPPAPTILPPDAATVALGGKLYDNWVETAQVAAPKGNSPLWAAQVTNKRTGVDTWRCKECHGWDYKGKDGDYGKGSHFTGFTGVYRAATTKTVAELIAILKGSSNSYHNFSAYLNGSQLSALASFLKLEAVLDESLYIDYSTRKPKSADTARGKQLFESSCISCHGTDGTKRNFGSDKEPEYVGTMAIDNPWEFLHKVRFGQPGAAMPSSVEQHWRIEDVINILSYAQTLPDK